MGNFNELDTDIHHYERRLKEDGLFMEIDDGTHYDVTYQILGMVSHYSDLFLFQRKVNYVPKTEVWLTGVEYSAQETVSKMIGYAVSSFPKQPLDEWIIDYPQQTILSTIHLILTHEINEMLHDLRKDTDDKKNESAIDNSNIQTDTLGIVDSSNMGEKIKIDASRTTNNYIDASGDMQENTTQKEIEDTKENIEDSNMRDPNESGIQDATDQNQTNEAENQSKIEDIKNQDSNVLEV